MPSIARGAHNYKLGVLLLATVKHTLPSSSLPLPPSPFLSLKLCRTLFLLLEELDSLAKQSSMSSRLNPQDRGLARRKERLGYLPHRQRETSGKLDRHYDLLCHISYDRKHVLLPRDPEQTKKLFEKYKPTHVIHLAALGLYLSSYMIYHQSAKILIDIFKSVDCSRT